MINFLTPVSPNTKFIESKIESAYLTINNIYNQYNHAVLIIDMTIFPYKKEWQVFHQTVDKNNAKKKLNIFARYLRPTFKSRTPPPPQTFKPNLVTYSAATRGGDVYKSQLRSPPLHFRSTHRREPVVFSS